MPRYFFDVRDRKGSYRDPEGVELLDIQEAREQGDAIVQAVARDRKPDADEWQWVCEIRDESGASLYRATLTTKLERTDFPQESA